MQATLINGFALRGVAVVQLHRIESPEHVGVHTIDDRPPLWITQHTCRVASNGYLTCLKMRCRQFAAYPSQSLRERMCLRQRQLILVSNQCQSIRSVQSTHRLQPRQRTGHPAGHGTLWHDEPIQQRSRRQDLAGNKSAAIGRRPIKQQRFQPPSSAACWQYNEMSTEVDLIAIACMQNKLARQRMQQMGSCPQKPSLNHCGSVYRVRQAQPGTISCAGVPVEHKRWCCKCLFGREIEQLVLTTPQACGCLQRGLGLREAEAG